MGATKDSEGQYSIACSSRSHLPNISFTFSGHPFSISPEDYIFNDEEFDDKNTCISAFFGHDLPPPDGYGPFAIVGTVFLRKWFSVFNLEAKTISFAAAKPRQPSEASYT